MIEKKDIFPTPVFSGKIENFKELNPVVTDLLYKMKLSDKGLNKSNIQGWHSNNNLHNDSLFNPIKEFSILKECLLTAANDIIRTMGYKASLRYNGLWGNINPKGARNGGHDHPGSIVSGAYYLKVPQPVCLLNLLDPRPVKAFVSKTYLPGDKVINNEYTTSTIPFIPEEGGFIFFPGWLKHSVDSNLSDDDRISLSFNFVFDNF
jgi:uncharacterized protein (TIGR02466 family)